MEAHIAYEPVATVASPESRFRRGLTLSDATMLVVESTIGSRNIPQIGVEGRLHLEDLGQGFYRAVAYYGFMETPTSRSS